MPTIALLRRPTASIDAGLRTHIERVPIDFKRAQEQHIDYATALREAGAEIVVLPAAEHLPDAAFIEDTALVLDSLAVMAHSAAESRRAETPTVAAALSQYCYLANLPQGACFDAGDALVIDRTVYLAESRRTNRSAIDYLKTLLRQHYYETVPVCVTGCLHLKTAVTCLGDNTVLLNPRWVPEALFSRLTRIAVDADEPMAANTLRVGQHLLMSASFPRTLDHVAASGFKPRAVDISEFHKAEGGLSYLSLLVQTR